MSEGTNEGRYERRYLRSYLRRYVLRSYKALAVLAPEWRQRIAFDKTRVHARLHRKNHFAKLISISEVYVIYFHSANARR